MGLGVSVELPLGSPEPLAQPGEGRGLWLLTFCPQTLLDMKAHFPPSRATLERLDFQTQLGAQPVVQHKRTCAFRAPARSAL